VPDADPPHRRPFAAGSAPMSSPGYRIIGSWRCRGPTLRSWRSRSSLARRAS
jgi:hypothetical protein